jgi:hypothetical protein
MTLPPETAELKEVAAPDLSLGEMLQIMDVARILKREQDIAREQFNRDEARELLRKRLLASTELTGSTVTAVEVDAAIEQYFNNLHTYRDPPWSPSVVFAHLYIRRWRVLFLLAIVCAMAFWWF